MNAFRSECNELLSLAVSLILSIATAIPYSSERSEARPIKTTDLTGKSVAVEVDLVLANTGINPFLICKLNYCYKQFSLML